MPRSYPPGMRRQVIELARSGTRVKQLAVTFAISEHESRECRCGCKRECCSQILNCVHSVVSLSCKKEDRSVRLKNASGAIAEDKQYVVRFGFVIKRFPVHAGGARRHPWNGKSQCCGPLP